jgi:hypothetical protein
VSFLECHNSAIVVEDLRHEKLTEGSGYGVPGAAREVFFPIAFLYS